MGRGLFNPSADKLKDGEEAFRVGGEQDDQAGDEYKGPLFELGDSAIGFAGLSVNIIEFFIDAVKALAKPIC